MLFSDLSYPLFTLVGAGPGDPELITVKGVKALSDADVVLYDALVNTDLLKFAPKAEKIFVGKRKNKHRFSQDEINQMVVSYAIKNKHVVRLKGGDSFVFGRGIEELRYASSFGISCKIIPGISSALAVPANQGISITERLFSESFWVVTATTTKNSFSKDIHLAAQSSATVVILMGLSKLPQIIETYSKLGKSHLPAAIIQEGTTPNEQSVYGTIGALEEKVKLKQIKSPAVIVIGEVVSRAFKQNAINQVLESAVNFEQ